MTIHVIGFCGLNGAGKTTAAKILVKNGYTFISLSDFIKESLKKKQVPATRENMIAEGNRLRKENGAEYLAKLAVEQIKKLEGNFVIDSIRNGYEVKYFKEQLEDFHMVKIGTELVSRYYRIDCRERLRDVKKDKLVTVEKFMEDEKQEFSTHRKNDVNAQHLDLVMKWADYTITNNGTLGDFEEAIQELVFNHLKVSN